MFNYGNTGIEHLNLCVVILLGFLLHFLTLLEKGRLETPTFVYEKNARVSKPLLTIYPVPE